MFSYFRNHYADHYTQMCLDLMQGQSLDPENLFITLVESVTSSLHEQFTPKCCSILSTENFVFSNELRISQFIFLLSRLVRKIVFFFFDYTFFFYLVLKF